MSSSVSGSGSASAVLLSSAVGRSGVSSGGSVGGSGSVSVGVVEIVEEEERIESESLTQSACSSLDVLSKVEEEVPSTPVSVPISTPSVPIPLTPVSVQTSPVSVQTVLPSVPLSVAATIASSDSIKNILYE